MSVPARLGDFEIVAEIGRGGFGIVYRAKQVSLHRDVALKVLYEHRVHTREEVARFEREAHAAARLDHPALVSVYAWGQDQGHFFIAQKLVGEGRTLADRLTELKSAGEPPKGYFREVAGVLASVADGLQHAHEEGIVHRDMKPSNILIDERGRPFLGDFGLAKVEDGLELSRTGDFAGSPYYMSPEQADSRRGTVDHRADIYGLGVTLYELLTFRPPFVGRSPHEIVRQILTEEPEPLTRIAPRVPRDLETICLHAMEKARARRYQTASEFAADLRAFLEGEPIAAVPVSTVSRIFRGARRHRAGVGMVALLLALIGVGGAAWKNWRDGEIERQREEQKAALTRQASSATSTVRQAQSEQVDALFTEAMEQDRDEEALKLQEFKGDVSRWLDTGQALLLDVIPDISDRETLDRISGTLEGQAIYDTVRQVQEYLVQQGGEGEPDPRLARASEWLAGAGWLNDAAAGLNVTLGNLVTGSAEPPPPASTPTLNLDTGEADAGAVTAGATPADAGPPPGSVQRPRPGAPGLVPPPGPSGVLGLPAQRARASSGRASAARPEGH